MPEMVVGLDLHLKKTQGTVMSVDGKILKQERFNTSKEDLEKFLEGLPPSTEVALESVGFCWPWVDLMDELGYTPLLANPTKVRAKAEDLRIR